MWQLRSANPNLPQWLRVVALAYGCQRANGHAPFPTRATPLVLVEPEPSLIGHEVRFTLTRGFERAGDGSVHVDVGSVFELGTTWTGDVAERRYGVTLSYGSLVGDHGEQNAWVARWLRDLSGQMVDGHGRIVGARFVNGGRALRDRQLWGAQGVVVEVTTRSRQA